MSENQVGLLLALAVIVLGQVLVTGLALLAGFLERLRCSNEESRLLGRQRRK